MTEPGPTTSVTILGEEYRFRGASPEMVQELARLVDGKFRELKDRRSALDLKRLAVMVCMNLAEEMMQERDRHGDLLRRAVDRTRRCRESLELALESSEAGASRSQFPIGS